MVNIQKILIISALSVAAFGCSSIETVKESLKEPKAKNETLDSNCCNYSAFKTAAPVQIQTGDEMYGTIDASKGLYSVYMLSDSVKDRYISVAAMVADEQVLSPAISFFDKDWSLIEKVGYESFDYFPVKFADGDRLETTINLASAKYYQTKYIAVHVDSNSINETFELIHPEQLFAEGRGLIPMNFESKTARLTGVGAIRVRLKQGGFFTNIMGNTKGTNTPASDSIFLHLRATGVVTHKEDIKAMKRHDAIKEAVASKDFAKALNLVEESEMNGDTEARRVFLTQLESQ